MKEKTRVLTFIVALTAFIVGIGYGFSNKSREYQVQKAGKESSSVNGLGGSFYLVDHTGKAVTEADYADRYKLMFFGFTHCPGICPGELQKMAEILDILHENGEKDREIAPLFISIDPERDDVAAMQDYISMFDDRLIGLTGTPEQVDVVKKAYRVYATKVENPMMGEGNYMMDHSTFMYLMSPDNSVVLIFDIKDKPENIARQILEVL